MLRWSTSRSRVSKQHLWFVLMRVAVVWSCAGKDAGVESATAASATATSDSVGTSSPATTTTTTQGLTDSPSSTTTNDTCSEPACGPGPGEDCSMWAQDCPDGYKCAMYSESGGFFPEAAHCVPLPRDPKQVNEICGGESWDVEDLDDCDRGLICVPITDSLFTCRPACLSDSPYGEGPVMCPIDGWECAALISGTGIAGFCLQPCDPLFQGCPDGQSCVPSNFAGSESVNFWCQLDFADPAPPPVDGSLCLCGIHCLYADCGVGRLCLDGELLPDCQGFCCTSYCDIYAPNSCALADQGAECIAFEGAGFVVPVGMEHIGFCGMPL